MATTSGGVFGGTTVSSQMGRVFANEKAKSRQRQMAAAQQRIMELDDVDFLESVQRVAEGIQTDVQEWSVKDANKRWKDLSNAVHLLQKSITARTKEADRRAELFKQMKDDLSRFTRDTMHIVNGHAQRARELQLLVEEAKHNKTYKSLLDHTAYALDETELHLELMDPTSESYRPAFAPVFYGEPDPEAPILARTQSATTQRREKKLRNARQEACEVRRLENLSRLRVILEEHKETLRRDTGDTWTDQELDDALPLPGRALGTVKRRSKLLKRYREEHMARLQRVYSLPSFGAAASVPKHVPLEQYLKRCKSGVSASSKSAMMSSSSAAAASAAATTTRRSTAQPPPPPPPPDIHSSSFLVAPALLPTNGG